MDDRSHSVKPVERGARRAGPPYRSRSGIRIRLIGMILLAIAELAWLAWFLIEPLAEHEQHRGRQRSCRPKGVARAQGASARRAGDVVPRVDPGAGPRGALATSRTFRSVCRSF